MNKKFYNKKKEIKIKGKIIIIKYL